MTHWPRSEHPPPRKGHNRRVTDEPGRLREVTTYFLRLGSTAFGGPAAHIALMRHDLVEQKGWIDWVNQQIDGLKAPPVAQAKKS